MVPYETYADGAEVDTPLYILVDDKTASASEILTSALQDNGRATVIVANSDRTFGKAVIQNVARLSDGSGVVVTTARYETPKRTDINQRGIGADRTVKCEKKESAESCLAQAL